MSFDLTGKTALDTGASQGIGRALALGLAKAGADVGLLARDVPLLEQGAQDVEALGRKAFVLPADVTDPAACQQLVADSLAALGHVDGLVNNASVAGLAGVPNMAAYGASKAAVISLTKTLELEWRPSGVRVNALCPGWTMTDLNRDLWSGPDKGAGFVASQALQRWATVEEMVGPLVFLASDASSYVTGQSLVVDGGQTAG